MEIPFRLLYNPLCPEVAPCRSGSRHENSTPFKRSRLPKASDTGTTSFLSVISDASQNNPGGLISPHPQVAIDVKFACRAGGSDTNVSLGRIIGVDKDVAQRTWVALGSYVKVMSGGVQIDVGPIDSQVDAFGVVTQSNSIADDL